ncbi:MAG: ABC transporter permease [Planctomycetota bacterium]|nr:ABC transporter permease [Planctomycetota bacterium]
MKGVTVIFRRELAGLFLTPLAWVLLLAAVGLNGFLLIAMLRSSGGDVNGVLNFLLGLGGAYWMLMITLPPLLTMRSISEESKSGQLEFLLTAPVTDAAVVVGKHLAVCAFLAVLWSVVPLYGLVLQLTGVTPDWGQLGMGYLGAVLVSALFSGIGMLASAASSTPLLAAFLGFVFNIAVLLLPLGASSVGGRVGGLLQPIAERLNVLQHLQTSFMRGAFDTADLFFFLAWTGLFLFASVRIVEARRWWT